jgi:uncharacterized protein (DUF2141 family)
MKWSWIAILVWMLVAACAQVREITGGDKDETPPELLAADPPDLSTGFRGQRIVLQFDERIQLDRVRDRLLVSPPLSKPPTVRITGAKNVTIDLESPLTENTTYTFGIGEVVKDLSEGNPAAGLSYVVSTGAFLDSMVVSGRVVNAFSGAPEKDALVTLYAADDTSTIRSGRPSYATRSDAQGRFTLRYLRPGRYSLHALRDKNANYRYDLPNEEVAFLDSMLMLEPGDTLLHEHTLRLFAAVSPVQAVRETRVTRDGALRVVLARPAREIAVRDVARVGGVLKWTDEWSAERDTVLLWPSDTTALGEGRYELRMDTAILDTVRYRRVERMPFALGVRAAVREGATEALVELRTERPVSSFDSSLIRIERDSIPIPFTLQRDSMNERLLRLRTDLPPGASATLIMLPKALQDIYGGHNDSLRIGLGRAAEQSTGTLRIRLDERVERVAAVIVQLLDAQGRTVRESKLPVGERAVAWERLSPGNHTIRMVFDLNGNGRWDTGDLDKGLQPEPVVPHGETINVRAAWDLAIDLRIE